jgi:peptidyl-dipeptidase Dcp
MTPEVLQRFAKHHQTGQPMPKALLDKIEKAQKFNQGFATTEYLSSALVDMALHMDPDGSSIPTRSSGRRWLGSACPRSW